MPHLQQEHGLVQINSNMRCIEIVERTSDMRVLFDKQ